MKCSKFLSCLGLLIFHFLRGPGLTLLEVGADIYNTAHYSDPCLFPSSIGVEPFGFIENCHTVNKSDVINLKNKTHDLDHDGECINIVKESWQENVATVSVIRSTFTKNKTCIVMLRNDPVWAGLSGAFMFVPGWIIAIYLLLGIQEWWDTDERVENLTVIIFGILGYPIMLVILQLFSWIWNHRKKGCENDFLSDFLPVILGAEAFGDAAPQAVLNGFVIASKYPLGRMQLTTLILSFFTTTLRILEFDFIHEMNDKDKEGSSKSVLAYITMDKKIRENKRKWAKFTVRVIVLFLFYLLCNVARSASLCCILLYCRQVGILPILINIGFVAHLIRIHHKGDWASCFMFSITNLFICSNGGPDNIKSTSFKLMASTTKVCMGVFVTFQLGSMFLAYMMRGMGDNPFESIKQYSEWIDLGHFGKASSGWFCAWVIFLNVIHFILLHIIKKWLPKTDWEMRMDLDTKSKEKQMEEQGKEYEQRKPRSQRGTRKSKSKAPENKPITDQDGTAILETSLAQAKATVERLEDELRIAKENNHNMEEDI